MSKSKSIEQRISDIKDRWFLTEPIYFTVICTHQIEITSGIKCGIACGGGVIYLNDKYFNDKSDIFLEESLKIELIRILLKHPYGRQLPNRIKMYLSSNFVIANNIRFNEVKMKTTEEYFKTLKYNKECLEVIYDNIELPDNNSEQQNSNNDQSNNDQSAGNNMQSPVQNTGGNRKKSSSQNIVKSLDNFDDCCLSEEDAFERSQFWKEDDYRTEEINKIIDKVESTKSWGSIPGNVVETIKNSIIPVFNYRAIFQQFRSTVLSSSYIKTRMKPSRRFGYQSMGSKRKNTTNILIAVDTSGSISNNDLQLAIGFINGFFKYAVDKLNVIQFDTKIYEESLVSITKAPKSWDMHGRGGTDFNPVFQYVQTEASEQYDGVIILTDGYAQSPDIKYLKNNYNHTKYLWVLNSKDSWVYFKNQKNFSKFGKCTYIDNHK